MTRCLLPAASVTAALATFAQALFVMTVHADALAQQMPPTPTQAQTQAQAPMDPQQPAVPTGLDAALEQQVRQLVLDGARLGRGGATRFEVSLGQLDPRLRLAPCQRIEPYLPNGASLWGKTRVGLRCTQGATKWNVYLPLTVRIFGRGLVATNVAAAGTVLSATDVAQAEVDLAEDTSPALVDAKAAVGRVLAQPLQPGQSLRQSHLKARQWFQAGETVTVIAQGGGFSVSSEAQAMTNGIEGQLAKVRTESGRVLTGQAVGEHRVELDL